MLSDNEYVEFEDRKYLNPQVALGESDAFIDNLRSTQQANNQQIQTDTYNLGTEVSSDLGGLTGGEGYFAARYQTPQTASAVSNLRAAAQAAALNQVLADEQAIWKNRYQQAYRNYQNRQYNNSRSGGSSLGNSGNGGNTSTWDGEIEDVVSDGTGGLSAVSELTLDENDMAAGGKYVVEPGSGNIIRIDDTLSVDNPDYQRVYYRQPDGSYITRDGKHIMQNKNALQDSAGNIFSAFQAFPISKGNS